MKDFFDKHYRTIMIVLLFAVFGVTGGNSISRVIFPDVAQLSEEVVGVIIGNILEEKINPLQESIARIEEKLSLENDYSVILLSMEMNQFRSASEVDIRIDFLEENHWNAQIAALKYVSDNQDAKEALKKRIVYDEVYKALLMRVERY